MSLAAPGETVVDHLVVAAATLEQGAALQLQGTEHLPPPGPALRATLTTPLGEVTLES